MYYLHFIDNYGNSNLWTLVKTKSLKKAVELVEKYNGPIRVNKLLENNTFEGVLSTNKKPGLYKKMVWKFKIK